MSQNASPPVLVMCGYATLSTALAAIAASTAEPPARSASAPAADASACGHATMPRNASVGARRGLHHLETDRAPDLRDLARVVVPVIVEHGADEHRDRDLVGAHELLEQRDLRLAPEI